MIKSIDKNLKKISTTPVTKNKNTKISLKPNKSKKENTLLIPKITKSTEKEIKRPNVISKKQLKKNKKPIITDVIEKPQQNILLSKNYYDKLIAEGLVPLSNELITVNDLIKIMLKKPNIPQNTYDILKLILLYNSDYTAYIKKEKISVKKQWETLHNIVTILCGSKKPWKNLQNNKLTFSEIENKLLNIFINNNHA